MLSVRNILRPHQKTNKKITLCEKSRKGEGGVEGESGEEGLCLCGMAEHTSEHLQDEMPTRHAGATLLTCSNCTGTSRIRIPLEKHVFTNSDSTSQEASSDPR